MIIINKERKEREEGREGNNKNNAYRSNNNQFERN